VSGFLTFVMGGRDLAAPLDQVREIIRAVGVQPMPGVRAPVTGLIELRGRSAAGGRPADGGRRGRGRRRRRDVARARGPVGVAVDRVLAVVEAGALVSDEGPRPIGLPAYVIEVVRTTDEAFRPLLLVDLRLLAGLSASTPPASGTTAAHS